MQVDEDQIFLLRLDAPATQESVQKNAWCVIDGIAERVPVEVLTGDARTQMLAQRKQLGYQYFRLLRKDGDRTNARVQDRSLEGAEAQIVLLRCQRRLPNATQVQLVRGSGIAATTGIATRQTQQLAFKVAPGIHRATHLHAHRSASGLHAGSADHASRSYFACSARTSSRSPPARSARASALTQRG